MIISDVELDNIPDEGLRTRLRTTVRGRRSGLGQLLNDMQSILHGLVRSIVPLDFRS